MGAVRRWCGARGGCCGTVSAPMEGRVRRIWGSRTRTSFEDLLCMDSQTV